MKKISFYILLAIVAFKATPIFAQQTQTSFKIKELPYPLTWETMPASQSITESGLMIEAQQGTDLYTSVDGKNYTNNIPKLLFKPDSNFIYTAKVSPSFQKANDGGALIVYSDKENWAKLLFEQNVDGSFGIWTTVSTEKKGDDNFHGTISSKAVYLKIAKKGSAFCFYYSLNGAKWTVIRAFALNKTEEAKIGFAAQSPAGNGCKVVFTEISYRPKKFSDFYSGE